MALVIADRVRETTSSAGTGTITLTGAFSSFQSFSVIGNGNTTYYAIIDSATGAWEVGVGTYTAAGNTLSRDSVLASSNSGSLVPFAAGLKDVICTQPATRAVYLDSASNVTVPGLTAAGQIVSTQTGSATTGAGQLYLNGATSNRIDFNSNGATTPSFTTRSDGTKITLFPALSGSQVDYAIGISAATQWYSVPVNSNSFFFKWFGGETQIASLDGTGVLTLAGNPILSAGTANGVTYLNGSKVLTSGSALAFDGTTLGVTGPISSTRTGAANYLLTDSSSATRSSLQQSSNALYFNASETAASSGQFIWRINSDYSEQMRLTSTGLGIGTSSPITKLQVSGTNATLTLSDTAASGGSYSNLLYRNTDGLGTAYNIGAVLGLTTSNGGNGALAFYTAASNSNAERMRLDSSGNLGIGTSSPAAKLDVLVPSIARLMIGYAGVSANYYDANNHIFRSAGGTDRLTLDSSGNLGLGVTPSTGGYGVAFQFAHVGNGGALTAQALDINNFPVNLTANAVSSSASTWKYANTDGGSASRYEQVAGRHQFFTAPSGTAGNAITFTQAMTLDASSNLLLNNTSQWSSEKFGITGSSASQRFIYARTTSNGQYLSLGTNGTLPYIEYGNGAGLAFTEGSTERARIDSAGLFTANFASAATAVTQAEKTASTTIATTAFVDRLRSLSTPATGTSGTLVVGDRGSLVAATGGITVPASVFAARDVVTIANNSGSSITITQGGGLTMYLVGTATTGNRTLAQRGVSTVVFISATVAIISGGGLT